MAILVDIRVGEVLTIDDGRITVRLEERSGRLARLAIEAPPNMKIERPRSRMGAAMAKGGLPPAEKAAR